MLSKGFDGEMISINYKYENKYNHVYTRFLPLHYRKGLVKSIRNWLHVDTITNKLCDLFDEGVRRDLHIGFSPQVKSPSYNQIISAYGKMYETN